MTDEELAIKREKARIASAKWYAKNKDKQREWSRKWAKDNPEKVRAAKRARWATMTQEQKRKRSIYKRDRKEQDAEHTREMALKYYYAHREQRLAQMREYRNSEEGKAKGAAHRAVHKALKEGTLVKKPCEVCGEARSNAHHEDYAKPLDVMWLCYRHHQRLHHEKNI